jgi:4-amino-4-deoxy-L-arabinose transferase-like glycosyltransferase
MRFSLAWILFPLVFFSLSSSKLPGYLLPALPAAAFIVGERLLRLASSDRNNVSFSQRQWPMKTTAILSLLFAVMTFAYTWRGGKLSLTSALLLAAPIFAAGCVAFLAARRPASAILFIALATVFAVLVALNVAAPAYAERQSTRRLLELADARGYSQAPVYGLLRDDRSPEFYAADRVVYEPDGEPTMYEGVGQVVAESRRRQATILTLARLNDVEQFRQLSSMRVDVIGDNGRVALIAVGPP